MANISYIGSPAQTYEDVNGVEVEIPAQEERLLRISLEQAFGEDASFCEPEDNLSLNRGLILEARGNCFLGFIQFDNLEIPEGNCFTQSLVPVSPSNFVVENRNV